MSDFIIVIGTVLIALGIILYATYLFGHRLRAGDSPVKSFWEWLKNILEAISGL
jgi:hypothetical protein